MGRGKGAICTVCRNEGELRYFALIKHCVDSLLTLWSVPTKFMYAEDLGEHESGLVATVEKLRVRNDANHFLTRNSPPIL